MYYKFCPFCQEIKLLSEFSIDMFNDYKIDPRPFTNCYCDDCRLLVNSNNYYDSDIFRRKKVLEILRNRVIARTKSAIDISATECSHLLGVDYPGYMKYLGTLFTAEMHWGNMQEWQIDHIKPVKNFDLNRRSERSNCFHFTNTQPIMLKDHKEKHAL